MDYHRTYSHWQSNPGEFWLEQSDLATWEQKPTRAFDPSAGVYGRWFPDARLNICFNCVDRHVLEGNGDRIALAYESPVTSSSARITYRELSEKVARLAAVLVRYNVEKGDRVIIYMPMIPETVVAMLACARIGAVHSVVFGGFSSPELAKRVVDADPALILSASCGVEPKRIVAYKPLLDAAMDQALAHPSMNRKIVPRIIFQRDIHRATLDQQGDVDWAGELRSAEQNQLSQECVWVSACDPLYILYTSGTTGMPKGVVRDTGGYLVALLWSMSNIYDVQPGEVFWAASDVGWVVGHSYIVYAPLAYGATTVLYEGKPVGTPDAAAFWRVLERTSAAVLFTAPTALRSIKQVDPQARLLANHDTSQLRTLFLAGERADTDTLNWATRHLGVPSVDHWWQTETGWTICGSPVGLSQLPIASGSVGYPMPGYSLAVLSDDGEPVPSGTLGNVVIRLPLPPGCLPSLWRNDTRFKSDYLDPFPQYYATFDAGVIDENGQISILARTDDVINVAGHRLSSGGLEEVIASHADVAECAVIGIREATKGEVPMALVVLNIDCNRPSEFICGEIKSRVRENIGPVATLASVMCVARLPKTRSGKILRNVLKNIADSDPWAAPATIDDPDVLPQIAQAFENSRCGDKRSGQ